MSIWVDPIILLTTLFTMLSVLKEEEELGEAMIIYQVAVTLKNSAAFLDSLVAANHERKKSLFLYWCSIAFSMIRPSSKFRFFRAE